MTLRPPPHPWYNTTRKRHLGLTPSRNVSLLEDYLSQHATLPLRAGGRRRDYSSQPATRHAAPLPAPSQPPRCTLGAVVRPDVGHARCLPLTAPGLTPARPPRSAPRSSPRRRVSVPPVDGSRGGNEGAGEVVRGAMGDSKVKVAVRVRPMNRRGESLLPQRPSRAPGAGVCGV